MSLLDSSGELVWSAAAEPSLSPAVPSLRMTKFYSELYPKYKLVGLKGARGLKLGSSDLVSSSVTCSLYFPQFPSVIILA